MTKTIISLNITGKYFEEMNNAIQFGDICLVNLGFSIFFLIITVIFRAFDMVFKKLNTQTMQQLFSLRFTYKDFNVFISYFRFSNINK